MTHSLNGAHGNLTEQTLRQKEGFGRQRREKGILSVREGDGWKVRGTRGAASWE